MVALGLSSDAGLLDAGRIGGLFEAVNAGLGGLSVRAPVEVVVVGGEAVLCSGTSGGLPTTSMLCRRVFPPCFGMEHFRYLDNAQALSVRLARPFVSHPYLPP